MTCVPAVGRPSIAASSSSPAVRPTASSLRSIVVSGGRQSSAMHLPVVEADQRDVLGHAPAASRRPSATPRAIWSLPQKTASMSALGGARRIWAAWRPQISLHSPNRRGRRRARGRRRRASPRRPRRAPSAEWWPVGPVMWAIRAGRSRAGARRRARAPAASSATSEQSCRVGRSGRRRRRPGSAGAGPSGGARVGAPAGDDDAVDPAAEQGAHVVLLADRVVAARRT